MCESGLTVGINSGDGAQEGSIFLTIDQAGTYNDAAGRWTSEGYSIYVSNTNVTIAGASSLGVWWGTRSLLQLAATGNGTILVGSTIDAPGWAERGVMLDAGRHYYPPDFLVEMCAYLSFFKQNTFHVHLSDNIVIAHVNNSNLLNDADYYAAFRLDSDNQGLEGLNRRKNESYTREVFDHVQRQCAKRGVTVLPEIEAPGHSLVFTQWKPELALTTDYTLLNISVPETIPTIQSVWKEFLPWFHSKTVSIGADEYDSSLPQEYNRFVEEMNNFIGRESGGVKTMRIWGTFPYNSSYTQNVNTNVSIQHWEFFEDNPLFDYIQHGYNVLNSDDAFYIVNKHSTGYPQMLNKTRIFFGAPGRQPYAPNILDINNATNNPPRNEPRIIGSIVPLWNDFGPNTTVVTEAYYAWRDNLPALADKQWGGDILIDEYDKVFEVLRAAVPGQNLDRSIASKSGVIVEYDFSKTNGDKIPDQSGNGYDGTNNGCSIADAVVTFDGSCSISTPLTSKGRNYSLSFSIKPTSSDPGVLISGPDSTLLAGNGSITNVTMVSGGIAYSLNYSLPVNTWSNVSLVASGNQTFWKVDDQPPQEFLTKVGVEELYFRWREMAFEAPLKCIGQGFKGTMRGFKLTDGSV